MKRNHLVAIAVGALILSSSNIGLAQAGSHKQEKKSHSKQEKVGPIKLKDGSGVLKLDTSTAVPRFQFDTSTVTAHIDIDENETPRFDTSTATSQGEDSENSQDQKSQDENQDGQGKHQGKQGNHDGQGDQNDSFSGTFPASPLGTRNS